MFEAKQFGLDFFHKIQGDLIFALILLVCLACSLGLRRFSALLKSSAGTYRILDGAVGFLLALAATRLMIFCSLAIVIAHLCLYKHVKNPRTLSNLSFYGTFAYLAVLRVMHYAGLPPLVYITNGIQLIMTLRVIGLSYEIADARITDSISKLEKDGLAGGDSADIRSAEKFLPKRTIREPTTLEAFNYLYGFVGLFTGPYYTYQTFIDSERFGHPTRECLTKLVHEKLSKLYWSLPLLLAFSWLDPVDALRGEKINAYSKLSLVIWSALAFIYFRMRIYTAWMISESICIMAGIGVYPMGMNARPGSGPRESAISSSSGALDENANVLGAMGAKTDEKLGVANESIDIAGEEVPKDIVEREDSVTGNEGLRARVTEMFAGGDAPSNFFSGNACECTSETISNLDIAQIEYSDGFRSGMRAWNRTVQFWLANFVYKRSAKAIRMPYTMLVSAFWHGIHPGYFLSFLTIPLCTTAEDLLFRIYPSESRPYWLSITWSFIRMRGFESMACGFLLLTWADTVRLWTNLYLWLHVTMIVVIVVAKIYLLFFHEKSRTPSRVELSGGRNLLSSDKKRLETILENERRSMEE